MWVGFRVRALASAALLAATSGCVSIQSLPPPPTSPALNPSASAVASHPPVTPSPPDSTPPPTWTLWWVDASHWQNRTWFGVPPSSGRDSFALDQDGHEVNHLVFDQGVGFAIDAPGDVSPPAQDSGSVDIRTVFVSTRDGTLSIDATVLSPPALDERDTNYLFTLVGSDPAGSDYALFVGSTREQPGKYGIGIVHPTDGEGTSSSTIVFMPFSAVEMSSDDGRVTATFGAGGTAFSFAVSLSGIPSTRCVQVRSYVSAIGLESGDQSPDSLGDCVVPFAF
jgi:hypothetical protein